MDDIKDLIVTTTPQLWGFEICDHPQEVIDFLNEQNQLIGDDDSNILIIPWIDKIVCFYNVITEE